jgi:hypothetical protein
MIKPRRGERDLWILGGAALHRCDPERKKPALAAEVIMREDGEQTRNATDLILTCSNLLLAMSERESRATEDSMQRSRVAEYCRLFSARFSASAREPQNPVMEQDLLSARYFMDKANLEEEFVARRRQRVADMAARRKQLLALRDRIADLETQRNTVAAVERQTLQQP